MLIKPQSVKEANSNQLRSPSAGDLQDQLQSATNLPTVPWLDKGAPFPGTGGPLATNLPIGPARKKFFRLWLLGN
jgi:hypothetical protein